MEKVLDYFTIDNSYGGNQDWMQDPWMKLGGCAALAAVDSCIYFALKLKIPNICPIDFSALSKVSYNKFASVMKPYLTPRFMGVRKLSMYTAGFSAYLRDYHSDALSMSAMPMGVPLREAREAVISQINKSCIIPILHLNARNKRVREYGWHWFILTGYREYDGLFQVLAVTYGNSEWLNLNDLWDENDSTNGGLILYHFEAETSLLPVIHVSAAVICDRADLPTMVYATKRGYGVNKGLWEFPGGKLEASESPENALHREIREELDTDIKIEKLLTIVEYDYPDFHLSMFCYLVTIADSHPPVLKEASEARWLTADTIHSVSWTPADSILPEIILAEMTDAEIRLSQIQAEENKVKTEDLSE